MVDFPQRLTQGRHWGGSLPECFIFDRASYQPKYVINVTSYFHKYMTQTYF